MCKYRNSPEQHGFTLIELMVLVAIVAILATVAVPDFSATVKNNRDIAQVNELLTGLILARSDAIKSGSNVTVCAGQSITCTGTPTPTWGSGWIVFYSGTPLPPGITSQIIQVSPPITDGNTFTSDGGYSFTFQANGALTPIPASPLNFTLCDPRGATYAHAIGLAFTGRAEAAAKVGYQLDGSTALVCP